MEQENFNSLVLELMKAENGDFSIDLSIFYENMGVEK